MYLFPLSSTHKIPEEATLARKKTARTPHTKPISLNLQIDERMSLWLPAYVFYTNRMRKSSVSYTDGNLSTWEGRICEGEVRSNPQFVCNGELPRKQKLVSQSACLDRLSSREKLGAPRSATQARRPRVFWAGMVQIHLYSRPPVQICPLQKPTIMMRPPNLNDMSRTDEIFQI